MSRDRRWRLEALSRARLLAIVGGPARGRPVEDVARAALDGGARFLELRLKDRPDAEVRQAAERLVALCEEARALLVVNDDARAAAAAGADGVHLGQEDLPPEAARRVVGAGALVGLSVHDAAEAARAAAAPVDYVGIGTVFASALRPDLRARGPAAVRALLPALGAIPGFAIGGIHAGNVAEVLATGVHGVAIGSAICEAEDVAAATRAVLRAIDGGAR